MEEIIENPISWASKERDKYWRKKIQNAQRRLKEEFKKLYADWDDLDEKVIDKIFKEEFGEKLTK